MNLGKTGWLLILFGLSSDLTAFSVRELIPYAFAAAASAYSGYKVCQEKADIKDVTAQEALPYAAVTVATLYGCYSVYAHNSATKKLEHKLEGAKEAVTHVSLAHLQTTIEEIEKKYEIPLRDGEVAGIADESASLYRVLSNRLKGGSTVASLEYDFIQDVKALRLCKNTLELTLKEGVGRISSCNEEQNQLGFDAIGQKLMYKAELVMSYVEKLAVALQEHKYYFIVENSVSALAHFSYNEEKRIVRLGDTATFAREIERHISSRYSSAEHQFPFLSYIEQIDKERDQLESALKHLDTYKPFSFQHATIQEGRELLDVLSTLTRLVVNTDTYQYQKAQKPLFDRSQEIHRQELYERKKLFDQRLYERATAVENEKKEIESRLLKRANKEKALKNQRLLIERAATQQKLDKQKLELQEEAYKSGRLTQEALEQNNRDWSAKYEYARSRVEALQMALQVAESQHKAFSDTAQREYHEWRALKLAVQNELIQLEQALEVPPVVTKEDVGTLTNYINLLKRHSGAARSLLS